jgi:hypothetical protein
VSYMGADGRRPVRASNVSSVPPAHRSRSKGRSTAISSSVAVAGQRAGSTAWSAATGYHATKPSGQVPAEPASSQPWTHGAPSGPVTGSDTIVMIRPAAIPEASPLASSRISGPLGSGPTRGTTTWVRLACGQPVLPEPSGAGTSAGTGDRGAGSPPHAVTVATTTRTRKARRAARTRP